MEFAPKASMSNRGAHPDLTDDGELLDDVLTTPDPKQRDFNRRWNDIYDTTFKDAYMQRLTSYQRSLPVGVQQFVQSRDYDSLQAYQAAIDTAMIVEGVTRGASVLLTDVQIGDMGLDEFNHYFNPDGTPKPGVKVHYQRAQRLDDTRP